MRSLLPIITIAILLIFQSCSKDDSITEDNLSAEKKYFLSVALGNEFGTNVQAIRKWNTDIRIYLKDTSNIELVEEFNLVKDELNQLSSSIKLKRVYVEAQANFVVFFSDKDTYVEYEPDAIDYVDENWGLFWVYWNSDYTIYKGSMFVDIVRNDDINCIKHIIREELTQSLGLVNDRIEHPQSIFYQKWSCVTSYTGLDKQVIKYFLNPLIESGMNQAEVRKVLDGIN